MVIVGVVMFVIGSQHSYSEVEFQMQISGNAFCILDGVGEVKVMITLRSCGAYIVEKDTRTSNSQNTQDQSGDKSTADAQDFEENTVFEKQENGAKTPYVKEITEPEVEGVIVAADGGNNAKTAADITDAVVALFGIEVHKIKVMKKV